MPKDPLCPLGFHPQVRWPTRCKRCFREYKEHSKKEEIAERIPSKSVAENKSDEATSSKDFSSPYSSLSTAALARLNKHREESKQQPVPEWKSFQATDTLLPPESGSNLRRNTTDLSQFLESERGSRDSILGGTEVNLTPPSYENASFTVKLRKSSSFNLEEDRGLSVSPSPPPRSKTPTPVPTFKLSSEELNPPEAKSPSKGTGKQSSGSQKSPLPPGSDDNGLGVPKVKKKKKRLLIQGVQEVVQQLSQEEIDEGVGVDDSSADVAFIIQVKSTRKKKKEDDDETMSMTTTTDTTETTLVDVNESQAYSNSSGISPWEHDEVKKEVERLREKCDKLEKEKGEILSRRVANLEAPKAQSTEYLKLQQRVNQLTTINEDQRDDLRHLESKVRELENDLATRPTSDLLQRTISELRSKVANAEAETEKLVEEKRDALRKMDDMQDEFEEMQDNFREEQSEEFATVKRELDEASKNCRLLQFKLRKVEKKSDQLEAEKKELEMRLDGLSNTKVAKLEEELAKAKSENEKLLKETSKDKSMKLELSPKLPLKKKSPVLTKALSGEKVDPEVPENANSEQLLRDLQSTLERESDLREQLKFAEEEVNSMRQKISRIEEENESLLIQIKRMSAKTKGDSKQGKDGDNFSMEKLDAGELKLQLELNEQESKILRRKVEELENQNNKLNKDLSAAEEKLQTLEHSTSVTKSKSVDEVSILRRKIIEKERDIERVQTELLALKNKSRTARGKSVEVDEATKRHDNESRAELKRVQEDMAKIKEEAVATVTKLNTELSKAKKDSETHESRSLQLGESNKTLLGHIEKFKRDIATMKEHYEAIQDDFVVKNSRLQTSQEEVLVNFKTLRKDYDTIDKELKALRETFNNRQDTWIKEKLSMQEQLKEMEHNSRKYTSIPGDSDSRRLKSVMKEQTEELGTNRREMETYKDQIVFMQRENDELRKQLEDFEKLSQAKMRTMSSEPAAKSDREMKAIRERLQAEEKSHKNEMAQMKLRHEQKLALHNEEISTVQSQLSRAKRERDTFRQMVDSAQRAIAELKSRNSDTLTRRDSVSGLEEAATGARAAVLSLQERIVSLEDELTESRRETSRSKTEFVTEKSNWEMKFGDMQQKINELEEDRLMGSGRARAAGQRTRLELAWQKEREEQQRRVKETTTLARDLKTTLLEVERERDREKIEARRRLEQTKVALEEEQEEMRRKVSESHCDLLELRDAHAKLRTANEKLRRDRERLEKEKDIQTKKELDVRRVLSERDGLLDELMTRLSPMAVSSQPTQLSAKVNLGEIVKSIQKIKGIREPEGLTTTKDIRRSNFRKAVSADEPETEDTARNAQIISISSSAYGKEHYGTAGSVSRAANKYTGSSSSSTLTLPSHGSTRTAELQARKTPSSYVKDPYNSKGSLYRKSLSLEQTVAMPDEQKIWKGDSEAGSAASLKSQNSIDSRGSSMDRFSTKSEKPKSTSFVGKVKKLVKSKSIEESTTAHRVVSAGVQAAGVGSSSNAGSNTSLSSDKSDGKREKDGGRSIKDKVKGMFRRSSRSPSAERTKAPAQAPQPPQRPSRESTPKRDSTQRPLMPTESTVRPLMPTIR